MNNIYLKNRLIELNFNSSQDDLKIIENMKNFDIENFNFAHIQCFAFNFQDKNIKIVNLKQENKAQ